MQFGKTPSLTERLVKFMQLNFEANANKSSADSFRELVAAPELMQAPPAHHTHLPPFPTPNTHPPTAAAQRRTLPPSPSPPPPQLARLHTHHDAHNHSHHALCTHAHTHTYTHIENHVDIRTDAHTCAHVRWHARWHVRWHARWYARWHVRCAGAARASAGARGCLPHHCVARQHAVRLPSAFKRQARLALVVPRQ